MHKGRTISANCEDQKTEDVDATELKKGSAEAAVCPYKTRVLKLQSTFFFWKISAVKLQTSYRSMQT